MNRARMLLILGVLLPVAGCLDDLDRAARQTTSGLFGSTDTRTEADLLEIDQVAKLTRDSAKFEGFMAIASRPSLPPTIQAHLARRAMESLYSEKDIQAVLEQLMAGRFSCEAKKEILENLDRFKSNDIRTELLLRINRMSGCFEEPADVPDAAHET